MKAISSGVAAVVLLLRLASMAVETDTKKAENQGKERVPPGSTAYLDDRNGFRDLLFGTLRGSVRGLSHSERSGFKSTGRGTGVLLGGPGCYTRSGDSLKIGKANLWPIIYCFHNDRLFSVNISTAEGAQLYDSLEAIWGKETSLTRGAVTGEEAHFTTEWRGRRVAARLEVSFVNLLGQLVPSRGDLEIWSISLAAEHESAEADAERRRKATQGRSVERDM